MEAEGAAVVLARTTAEELYLHLAAYLDEAGHSDEAQELGEGIVALWKAVHGVAGPGAEGRGAGGRPAWN